MRKLSYLVLSLIFIIAGCSSSGQSYSDIEDEVSERLGTEVHFVNPEGYDLFGVTKHPREGDEVSNIGLLYSLSEEEKELVAKNDKQIEQLEKQYRAELIYGPYDGFYTFRMSIMPIEENFNIDSLVEDNANIEIIEVSDKEIAYFEDNMTPKKIIVTVPFEQLKFHINMPKGTSEGEFTKEAAIDYIEKLISAQKN